MSHIIDIIEQQQLKESQPAFRPGDALRWRTRRGRHRRRTLPTAGVTCRVSIPGPRDRSGRQDRILSPRPRGLPGRAGSASWGAPVRAGAAGYLVARMLREPEGESWPTATSAS